MVQKYIRVDRLQGDKAEKVKEDADSINSFLVKRLGKEGLQTKLEEIKKRMEERKNEIQEKNKINSEFIKFHHEKCQQLETEISNLVTKINNAKSSEKLTLINERDQKEKEEIRIKLYFSEPKLNKLIRKYEEKAAKTEASIDEINKLIEGLNE